VEFLDRAYSLSEEEVDIEVEVYWCVADMRLKRQSLVGEN
jgi:hypothetical protein